MVSRKRAPAVPLDLTGDPDPHTTRGHARAAARADLVSDILDTLAAEDQRDGAGGAAHTVRVELEVSRDLWGEVCAVAGKGNRLAIAQFVHDALCRELLRRSAQSE